MFKFYITMLALPFAFVCCIFHTDVTQLNALIKNAFHVGLP